MPPGPGADHPPDFPAGLPRPGAAEGEAGGLAAAGAAPAALVHRPDAAHPAGEAGRGTAAAWGPWLEHPGSVPCPLESSGAFQLLCPLAVRAASTDKVPLLPPSPGALRAAP